MISSGKKFSTLRDRASLCQWWHQPEYYTQVRMRDARHKATYFTVRTPSNVWYESEKISRFPSAQISEMNLRIRHLQHMYYYHLPVVQGKHTFSLLVERKKKKIKNQKPTTKKKVDHDKHQIVPPKNRSTILQWNRKLKLVYRRLRNW